MNIALDMLANVGPNIFCYILYNFRMRPQLNVSINMHKRKW